MYETTKTFFGAIVKTPHYIMSAIFAQTNQRRVSTALVFSTSLIVILVQTCFNTK